MHDERPRLAITGGKPGEPLAYVCSHCGQPFPLPETKTPKEAVAELWNAFRVHVQEKHADGWDITNTGK